VLAEPRHRPSVEALVGDLSERAISQWQEKSLEEWEDSQGDATPDEDPSKGAVAVILSSELYLRAVSVLEPVNDDYLFLRLLGA